MFAPNNTAASGNNSNAGNANASRGDFEKAKGFINVYVPTAGGGRVKVGTMPLRESVKGEKAVYDHINAATDEADLEARMSQIVNKLQFEFNQAEGKAVELAL